MPSTGRIYRALGGKKVLRQPAHRYGALIDHVHAGLPYAAVDAVVKLKEGPGYGDPLEAVDEWKRERMRRGAQAWLLTNPGLSALQVCFDFAAVRPAGIEVVADPLH